MPRPQLSGFRIRQGEKLRLNFISSSAQIFDALARIVYDDGSDDQLEIAQSTSLGNRTLELAESKTQAKQNGTVTNAYVGIITSGTKRGTFFAQLGLGPTLTTILCRGYVYTMRNLNLGEFQEPGPGGGEGFLAWETVATDAAGNTTTGFNPDVTNAFRKILGILLLYNADGNAASRILRLVIRTTLAAPTGFGTTTTLDIANIAGPTLTLGEEGSLFVYNSGKGDGFIALNDNGTVTYKSTATDPNPLPFLAVETTWADFFLSADAGLAGDVYNVYALVEEWLVI